MTAFFPFLCEPIMAAGHDSLSIRQRINRDFFIYGTEKPPFCGIGKEAILRNLLDDAVIDRSV